MFLFKIIKMPILVVLESRNKVKKVQSFLGKDYIVTASWSS